MISKFTSLKCSILKVLALSLFAAFFFFAQSVQAVNNPYGKKYFIDNQSSYYVNLETWEDAPGAGDTIFISAERTKPLRFQFITGEQNNPIVVINHGGQVDIKSTAWGAIVFENCRYIKITGEGHEDYKYGFKLAAEKCGLGFVELSSNCEAAFIKISHEGFFGIMAKKDYQGFPPSPIPVFEHLVIHDCFIEGAVEGMYLGETKSPGMEFKHVRIYNNIVRNTGRESIQIANMVEDVEIYNNTLLNAGLHELNQQNNILQIGDNSVAKVYNNIMLNAPGCGLISFGKGDNIYTNNYMGYCKGIFIDERKFTVEEDSIIIANNYFTNNVDRGWIVRNMNQYNPLRITNNIWDSDFSFYKNDSGNKDNYVVEDNENAAIAPIIFTDEAQNDYSLAIGNPAAYADLGAPGGPEFFGQEDGSGDDEPVVEQIILNAEMIVDEVEGGSYWTPEYLVDEQDATPINEVHPESQSWKPFWNMDKGPYHVYVDLGREYQLTQIALHDMHNTKNLEISIGEPGNWESLLIEPCDKYKTWKQHDVNVATRYVRLSMTESVFAAVNELVLYGYALIPAEAPQIVLNANMLVDEVEGGSYWSAEYLVDEQNLTPAEEVHPESQSWKPFWNMDKGPYHVYFDLGQYYELSKIALHDMHDTRNLEISVGEPGNWEYLLTESCDKYKTWKEHEVQVTTRYLRLSMTESVFAAVNELVLYGFALQQQSAEKSVSIPMQFAIAEEVVTDVEDVFTAQNLTVLGNPVRDRLVLEVPQNLSENFRIEIYNLKGVQVLSKDFIRSSARLSIDVSHECAQCGIYVMQYSNLEGEYRTVKFVKARF